MPSLDDAKSFSEDRLDQFRRTCKQSTAPEHSCDGEALSVVASVGEKKSFSYDAGVIQQQATQVSEFLVPSQVEIMFSRSPWLLASLELYLPFPFSLFAASASSCS